jgi:23S rRNA (uracil1939-C5)-methyltransferase
MFIPEVWRSTAEPVLHAAAMILTIEKVVYGGQGLARVPTNGDESIGMRVFVPFTLPEEIIEVDITEEHRGYCIGEARRVEHGSEFRTAAPCPWFGPCGGCQLQHSAYPFQVEMKCRMLAENLLRTGIQELPEITSLSGNPLAYRNRIRLHVEARPAFTIGYRHAKSHRLLAIDRCPIAMPILERGISAIQSLGTAGSVPAGSTEIELFTNHDQSELLLTLWVTQRAKLDQKHATEFFLKLQEEIPQLSGGAILAAKEHPMPGMRPLLEWERQSLQYRVDRREYSVGVESFFQINASLLDAFVGAVVGGEAGEYAWDLYAGSGLFARGLLERFRRVLAVESSPSSSRDLRKNLRGTNGVAINSTTLDFLKNSAKEAVPDLLLLDPPRAGAGVEVCRLMAARDPRRIVYVSCDPATLGRDLAALIQSGYRLLRLQMVDMFPQTGHLETIATLGR